MRVTFGWKFQDKVQNIAMGRRLFEKRLPRFAIVIEIKCLAKAALMVNGIPEILSMLILFAVAFPQHMTYGFMIFQKTQELVNKSWHQFQEL